MREKNPVTLEEKLAYLRELREEAVHAGSEEAVEKQHAKGKLTAASGSRSCSTRAPSRSSTPSSATAPTSSTCRSAPYGDAVVTGYGTIDGRTVFVF